MRDELVQRFLQSGQHARFVLPAVAAALCQVAAAAPQLSDRDAAALAGKLFSTFEHFPVPIGTFSVVREDANPTAGRLGARDDALVRAASKVGLVAVKADRAFRAGGQGQGVTRAGGPQGQGVRSPLLPSLAHRVKIAHLD